MLILPSSKHINIQRLLLICAVIEKRLKLQLWNRDVYVNVAGGLRVSEPASDLAVAITVVSSLLGVPIRARTAFVGEVGLAGCVIVVMWRGSARITSLGILLRPGG